jgi:hypothetical protein
MSWRKDLNYGLAAFGVQIPDHLPIDDLAAKLNGAPLRNSASLVASSAALFLIAERGHNPKVRDIYDALIYCSTCLSVGFADIFPRTPIGKLIGTFLMTVGPSLAAKGLEGRAESKEADPNPAVQQEILATLQAILGKMDEGVARVPT